MPATTLHNPFPGFAVGLGVLTMCLSACSGGDSPGQTPVMSALPSSSPARTASPVFADDSHGHFIGEVTIAGQTYLSEALLTVDGEVRIYVGAVAEASSNSGAFPEAWFHPQESSLFVGTISSVDGASASGIGAVIGQICDSRSARFCDEPAPAEMFLETSSDGPYRTLAGELLLTSADGDERWTLALGSHSIYYAAGTGLPGDYPGTFIERLAPFAQAEEMALEIEPDGRLIFTSAASGCTGNGTLAPHLDGRYDVYDVRLRISDCDAQFAYLDSEFEGLATETQSGTWDYDTWLVIFLSAPEGPPPRPALTMRAHLEESADASQGYWDY